MEIFKTYVKGDKNGNNNSDNGIKLPNIGGTPVAAVGVLGTVIATAGVFILKRKSE